MHRQAAERAVLFLAEAIQSSGNNPKPVTLHSVHVGIMLLEEGCDSDTVVAGILHDVVEDSDMTLEEVRARFGHTVAELVGANTFDPALDREKRDLDTLKRCQQVGDSALLVKLADVLENWDAFRETMPEALDALFLKKARMLLDASQDSLGGTGLWRTLRERFDAS